jgi:hypothetical protein
VALSCEEYEYTSPLPGLLDVRLLALNSGPDSLYHPFGRSNSFVLTLKNLEVIRSDGARLPVYANEYAIGRSTNGDPFNCLDTLARDSAMILGRAFAPPGVFTHVEMTIELFIPVVSIGNQSSTPTIIPVITLQSMTQFRLQIPVAEVEENRLTRVTVTIDLDRTLVRRLNDFEYRPYFYVSSVGVF